MRAAGLDKPYVFAVFTTFIAIIVTLLMLLWGQSSPEQVLIGLPGRHDGPEGGERLAACLDCHVPFVGTPGSRCLGPGCHGALATGTPPREGPAMPIRFHAVLREVPCSLCHVEHVDGDETAARRTFTHDMIPVGHRAECSRCHLGATLESHATTDAVECSLCHDTGAWRGARVAHTKVAIQPCDLCHAAPEDERHASIAGSCFECHTPTTWDERPAPK